MKRAHRHWHRRIGWLLLPFVASTLGLIAFTREGPADNAALPPVLIDTPAHDGR